MVREPQVLIVDDHSDFTQSVQDLLTAEGLESISFPTAELFLQTITPDQQGCVLLDVRLPGMSGVDCQEALRSRGVRLPVIVITGEATVTDTIRAFDNAAYRVFEKPLEPAELLDTVRQAIAVDSRNRLAEAEHSRRLSQLTSREREVLELLIEDKPAKQIARELGLSPSTVEKHRAKVLAKVGVNSVVGLTRFSFAAKQASAQTTQFRSLKRTVPSQ